MQAFAAFGRFLFSILFIVSGGYKLSDISGMVQTVTARIPIPPEVLTYTSQIETATGMPIAQLIVIVSGAFEVLAGVLIALNFGTRIVSVLLAIFVALTIVYFHDFWNQSGAERWSTIFEALKNVSLIGALLMLAASPRLSPMAEGDGYHGV